MYAHCKLRADVSLVIIAMASHSRHGVSNQQPLDGLLDNSWQIKLNIKAPHHWLFVRGSHQWLHKSPLMGKGYPYPNVITWYITTHSQGRDLTNSLGSPFIISAFRFTRPACGFWECQTWKDLPALFSNLSWSLNSVSCVLNIIDTKIPKVLNSSMYIK